MGNLVLAATFPDVTTASIARGMLANNNIPSVLDNAILSSVYPFSFNSMGEVRLMVNSNDLDEAVRLLKAHGDLN